MQCCCCVTGTWFGEAASIWHGVQRGMWSQSSRSQTGWWLVDPPPSSPQPRHPHTHTHTHIHTHMHAQAHAPAVNVTRFVLQLHHMTDCTNCTVCWFLIQVVDKIIDRPPAETRVCPALTFFTSFYGWCFQPVHWTVLASCWHLMATMKSVVTFCWKSRANTNFQG